MNKIIETMKWIKWLCFPLGYIMYFFTRDSFGEIIAILLAVFSTVSFWFLINIEETRFIGQGIAEIIKQGISDIGNIANVIEIKQVKRGIVARVYLINAKELTTTINVAIEERLRDCAYKKYLWIMQLTSMPDMDSLKQRQKELNAQLMYEIMKNKDGEKK